MHSSSSLLNRKQKQRSYIENTVLLIPPLSETTRHCMYSFWGLSQRRLIPRTLCMCRQCLGPTLQSQRSDSCWLWRFCQAAPLQGWWSHAVSLMSRWTSSWCPPSPWKLWTLYQPHTPERRRWTGAQHWTEDRGSQQAWRCPHLKERRERWENRHQTTSLCQIWGYIDDHITTHKLQRQYR